MAYKLKDSIKKQKEELTNYPLRFISRPISWLLLKTPATPNKVTVFSFILSIIGAFFFLQGGYKNIVIGALFAFGYIIFDFVDGEIARAKNMISKKGYYMDVLVGFINYPMLIFCLAYGLKNNIALIFALLAIIAYPMQYAIIYFYKSEIIKSKGKISLPVSSKLDFIRYVYGSSLFYPLLLIFCLINKPLALLIFYAIFGNLFWIATAALQYKNIKN